MVDHYAQRLPYLMRVTSHALSQQLERTLRPFELTHAQLAALAQLGLPSTDWLSSAELAHRAGVTAQSMSEAVASLLQRGLVVRTRHPTHGRLLEVRITQEGEQLCECAQAATQAIEDRALAGLPAEEKEELRRLLRQVMQSLGLFVTA